MQQRPASATSLPSLDRDAVQQQVLHILAQHPAGLTPGAIASQLGLTNSLRPVLQAMVQAGLVQRVTAEEYALGPGVQG